MVAVRECIQPRRDRGVHVRCGQSRHLLGLLTPHGLLELTAVFPRRLCRMRLGLVGGLAGQTGRAGRCLPNGAVGVAAVAVGLIGVLLVSGLIEAIGDALATADYCAHRHRGSRPEIAFLAALLFHFGRKAVMAGETRRCRRRPRRRPDALEPAAGPCTSPNSGRRAREPVPLAGHPPRRHPSAAAATRSHAGRCAPARPQRRRTPGRRRRDPPPGSRRAGPRQPRVVPDAWRTACGSTAIKPLVERRRIQIRQKDHEGPLPGSGVARRPPSRGRRIPPARVAGAPSPPPTCARSSLRDAL